MEIARGEINLEILKASGNTVYYQMEEPTGDNLKAGDIWYKYTYEEAEDGKKRNASLYVYSEDGIWALTPFTKEMIYAKTITASEIASDTITAGEINMDDLQTNIARIGSKSGNNVFITDADIKIRSGDTTLASYGESVVIGEQNSSSMEISKNEFKIANEGDAQFSVKGFSKGTSISDVWLNDNLLDSYWERVFYLDLMEDDIAEKGFWATSCVFSFQPLDAMNSFTPKLIFRDGTEQEVPKEESGTSQKIYYTHYSKNEDYIYEEEDGTNRVIYIYVTDASYYDWSNIVAISTEYTLSFNPVTVKIGDGCTPDSAAIGDVVSYDYKALKIGKGKVSQTASTEDAFQITYDGDAKFNGSVNINNNLQAQAIATGSLWATEEIYGKNLCTNNQSTMEELPLHKVTTGTGKITCTTGAVSTQITYAKWGYVVQIYARV